MQSTYAIVRHVGHGRWYYVAKLVEIDGAVYAHIVYRDSFKSKAKAREEARKLGPVEPTLFERSFVLPSIEPVKQVED